MTVPVTLGGPVVAAARGIKLVVELLTADGPGEWPPVRRGRAAWPGPARPSSGLPGTRALAGVVAGAAQPPKSSVAHTWPLAYPTPMPTQRYAPERILARCSGEFTHAVFMSLALMDAGPCRMFSPRVLKFW
jgi:hypothetical protein